MLDLKVEHWKQWGVRDVLRQILLDENRARMPQRAAPAAAAAASTGKDERRTALSSAAVTAATAAAAAGQQSRASLRAADSQRLDGDDDDDDDDDDGFDDMDGDRGSSLAAMDCDDDNSDDEYVLPEPGAALHQLRIRRKEERRLWAERRAEILARTSAASTSSSLSSSSSPHSPSSSSSTAAESVAAAAAAAVSLPEHAKFSSKFVWEGGADWQPHAWSDVMTSMADTFSPAKPDNSVLKRIRSFFHVSELQERQLPMQLLPRSQRLSTEVLKEEVLCWEEATRALTAKGYMTPHFLLKVHASLSVMQQMYGNYGNDIVTDDEADDDDDAAAAVAAAQRSGLDDHGTPAADVVTAPHPAAAAEIQPAAAAAAAVSVAQVRTNGHSAEVITTPPVLPFSNAAPSSTASDSRLASPTPSPGRGRISALPTASSITAAAPMARSSSQGAVRVPSPRSAFTSTATAATAAPSPSVPQPTPEQLQPSRGPLHSRSLQLRRASSRRRACTPMPMPAGRDGDLSDGSDSPSDRPLSQVY